mgnify:FL=1|jgi:hypothetical protein
MYEDKKLPSKMRTFRFNDAMEGDLAFLMELWNCTATEALTRALSNSAVLERAFAIQRPAAGIHETIPSAASNNADQTIPAADELPTAIPEVAKGDPIQSQTFAEIEKSAPSTPIIKEASAFAPASATGESAASVPAKTKGGNKVRYQFKIFLKDEPDTKPGTASGETAEIAIANAKKWLVEHGREDFEPYFPAGTHCKTFKI